VGVSASICLSLSKNNIFARSGKPFEVVYKTADEYTKELVPNPPSIYINMATRLSLALLDGRFSFEPNFDAVSHAFIQPAEFVQKWWGSVEK
jgi:hypothetical protein